MYPPAMTENRRRTWESAAGPADAGSRLDQFWGRELAGEGVSRERIKDWIRDGGAAIDGRLCRKPNQRLEGRESLTLAGEDPHSGLQAEGGALDLLYRDEHLAVLDKPAGLTTHPAPGLAEGTLVHRLLHHFPEIRVLDEQRPGIVHRLDKDTSGLMVVALTSAARLALSEEFAERRVSKAYLAVVHGRPRFESGRIDAPIGRHPTRKTLMAVLDKGGRPARSDWRLVWADPRGRASLLLVRIHTGRTHQVRVHLAHIGHPLVGDAVYGPREQAAWKARGGRLAGLAPRQMLHAFRLAFEHPVTGERLHFYRRPPRDFRDLLAALDAGCLRVGLVGLPGAGKSALLAALARRGAPVFSADAEVAALYAPGGDGAQLLQARFGGDYSRPDGGVDKPALLRAMAESRGLRHEVNTLIHPLVWHRLQAFWQDREEAPAAFAEVALLLESGQREAADVVACVWRPDEARRADAAARRGLSAQTLALFDSWQWSGADKLRACQLVVDNSGTLEDLERRAEGLLAAADRLAEARRARRQAWFEALWPRLDRELAAEGA